MNRSQADINKNIDMIFARRKEREYFATSPDYAHLASKMGSEYLAKLLSKVRLCFYCTIVYILLKGAVSDEFGICYSIWNLLLGLGYRVLRP